MHCDASWAPAGQSAKRIVSTDGWMAGSSQTLAAYLAATTSPPNIRSQRLRRSSVARLRRVNSAQSSGRGCGDCGEHRCSWPIPVPQLGAGECGTATLSACWSRCGAALGQPKARRYQTSRASSAQSTRDRRVAHGVLPQLGESVPRFTPKSRDVSLVEGRNFVAEGSSHLTERCHVPHRRGACQSQSPVALN